MSEDRIPDRLITIRLPRRDGKILHDNLPLVKYELYGAYQFKLKHSRLDKNFLPKVPVLLKERVEWYRTMYRVRINGKWFSPSGTQYEFFTKEQIAYNLLYGEEVQ